MLRQTRRGCRPTAPFAATRQVSLAISPPLPRREAELRRTNRAGQVVLLLKSSDKVAENLARDPGPHWLMLRKFRSINPALEFRCFVARRKLLAMSQRQCVHHCSPMLSRARSATICSCGQHFPFLDTDDDVQALVALAIQTLYHDRLRSTLPEQVVVRVSLPAANGCVQSR